MQPPSQPTHRCAAAPACRPSRLVAAPWRPPAARAGRSAGWWPRGCGRGTPGCLPPRRRRLRAAQGMVRRRWRRSGTWHEGEGAEQHRAPGWWQGSARSTREMAQARHKRTEDGVGQHMAQGRWRRLGTSRKEGLVQVSTRHGTKDVAHVRHESRGRWCRSAHGSRETLWIRHRSREIWCRSGASHDKQVRGRWQPC